MKQTIKINLGGLIFHIDNDAFQKLKNYLDSISSHFGNIEEGKEIIEDIESRLAELFQPKVNEHKQSILLEDVEEAISIMGNPEEFEEFGEQIYDEETSTNSKTKTRRLYRDTDNRVFGGVLAGISAYLNADLTALRIILGFIIIITFITGMVGALFSILSIYFLLWIVIPKALTRSQKLEMRGENITIPNIEKSIKNEYESVKGNLKNIKNSKAYEKTREVSHDILNVLGSILKVIVKIILGIIGVSLIIGGIFILTGFFSSIAFHESINFHLFEFPNIKFPYLYNFYLETQESPLLLISLLFSVTIPLVALVYGGIKLMFRFKANDRLIGVAAFTLWIISIVILITLLFFEGRNFAINGKYTRTKTIEPSQAKTIYLEINPNEERTEFDSDRKDKEFFGIVINNNEKIFYGKPTLNIVQAEGNNTSIRIEKKSTGRNQKYAIRNAKKINYHWSQKDSILVFDPYFSVNKTKNWKAPKVKITIELPLNKSIYLDEDMIQIIYDIENVSNTWDEDMVGEKWIMKRSGLTLVKRK